LPNLISLTDHANVAKAYVTAFFQAHLSGRAEQLEYFSAGLKPSLVSGLKIHTSHQVEGKVLDDFQNQNPAVNALGSAVTPTDLPGLAEAQLRSLDSHSPHVVAGGNVAWQSSSGVYLTNLPLTAKDLSPFDMLSFRVTQKYESPQNLAGNALDFDVRLTDH